MSNGPLMLVRMRERLVVDGFDGERKLYRQRLQDVYKRLTSYHSCEGATFAFVGGLADKRRQLREVDEALAQSATDDSKMQKAAA